MCLGPLNLITLNRTLAWTKIEPPIVMYSGAPSKLHFYLSISNKEVLLCTCHPPKYVYTNYKKKLSFEANS